MSSTSLQEADLFVVKSHVIYNAPLPSLGHVGREWVPEPLVEHLERVQVKYRAHAYGIVSSVHIDGVEIAAGVKMGCEQAVRLYALQEVLTAYRSL